METAILSSKGPIVIPKTVRDDAHITTGTLIEVRYVDGEILLRPLADCTARRQTPCAQRWAPMRKAWTLPMPCTWAWA